MILKISVFLLFLISSYGSVSAQERTPAELFSEVSNYVANRSREAAAKGDRVTNEKRAQFEDERKGVAKKNAEELGKRSNLGIEELYYLGNLYDFAQNETKSLEAYQQFLRTISADAVGESVQEVRSKVVILLGKKKDFDAMETAYSKWLSGSPAQPKLRPFLELSIANFYYRDQRYDESIKRAESGFDAVKKLEAKTWRERNEKTDVYANFVDILVLNYQRTKRRDDALRILAEGRVLSFTIPSARLYRRVMEIVDKSGVSEKKLMQTIESIQTADPAPEIDIENWLGAEAKSLESLRGKVVLLDFWATWCGPCISTFPKLRGWQKKYNEKGFEIIGVTQFYGSVNEERANRAQETAYLKEFIAKHKLNYSIAISTRSVTQDSFDVQALPTTVLLDRKGVVRYIGIGAGDEETLNLQDMVDKLIKEQ